MGTASKIRREHPQIKLFIVENSLEGLKAVQAGKADAWIDAYATSRFLIDNNHMTNLALGGEIIDAGDFRFVPHYIGVRKDWPMLRRLVEAHYVRNRRSPTDRQIAFWLNEARAPTLLMELAVKYGDQTRQLSRRRPLLALALDQQEELLEWALADEERREREADRAYWDPLRQELERLRHRATRRSTR